MRRLPLARHRSASDPGNTGRAATLALLLVIVVAACGGTATEPPSGPPATPGVTAGTQPTAPAASPAPSMGAPYQPVPRSAASMAWDPNGEVVLLFGGDTESGQTNALDAWDGATWTRLATDGPTARNDALLVADPARHVMVLFGGRAGERVFDDTWTWDGARWSEVDVEGPPPRVHASAAFDAGSKRVLLYGGVSAGDEPLHDTWAWDGTAWALVDDTGIPGLVPTGMAWDPTLDRPLVLAVDLAAPSGDQTYPSSLWGWTGSGWELEAEGGPSFSPLQSFVEGPRHPWLVDGGVVQGTFATLEWTGEAWASLPGAAPSVRNGQAAAFDAVRHQLVLFGGSLGDRTFGDTWRIDGGAWHEVAIP